jgi:hypothetical protein
MGRPKNPGKAAIDFLKAAAVPRVDSAVIAPAGGKLTIELLLKRNEITLVECSPFVDESGDYLGLDDSLVDGYTMETGAKAALE